MTTGTQTLHDLAVLETSYTYPGMFSSSPNTPLTSFVDSSAIVPLSTSPPAEQAYYSQQYSAPVYAPSYQLAPPPHPSQFNSLGAFTASPISPPIQSPMEYVAPEFLSSPPGAYQNGWNHNHQFPVPIQPMSEVPSRHREQTYLMINNQLSRSMDFRFRKPVCGLQNHGNTCFLGSLLQALYLTSCFSANIFLFRLPSDSKKSESDNPGLLRELQILIAHLTITDRKYISPKNVLDELPSFFTDGIQHDTTEVARHIFAAFGGQDKELIRLVFAGEICTKTACTRCGRVSERAETIHDFGLHVPTEAETANRRKNNISVQSLFGEFLKTEVLENDNAYHCEACQMKVEANRWTEITSPPSHLFVVLNRFSWDLSTGTQQKQQTPVEIDDHILVGRWDYKLYAAIMHKGSTPSSGHYFTIGRRSEETRNSHWYKFDDSRVSKVNQDEVQGSEGETAYVVLYRCNQAIPCPPLRIGHKIYAAAKKRDRTE